MTVYAQMLKETNEVVLVGDEELGLPIYNHELVYCVEVSRETDVCVGMFYSPIRKIFEEKQVDNPKKLNVNLTEAEQRELDRDEMLIDLLIQQQEILLELQTQAANQAVYFYALAQAGALGEVICVELSMEFWLQIVIYAVSFATAWGAVTTRIKYLEQKVEKHNNVVERVYGVEQSVKSAHHRIDEIKGGHQA